MSRKFHFDFFNIGRLAANVAAQLFGRRHRFAVTPNLWCRAGAGPLSVSQSVGLSVCRRRRNSAIYGGGANGPGHPRRADDLIGPALGSPIIIMPVKNGLSILVK